MHHQSRHGDISDFFNGTCRRRDLKYVNTRKYLHITIQSFIITREPRKIWSMNDWREHDSLQTPTD